MFEAEQKTAGLAEVTFTQNIDTHVSYFIQRPTC